MSVYLMHKPVFVCVRTPKNVVCSYASVSSRQKASPAIHAPCRLLAHASCFHGNSHVILLSDCVQVTTALEA